MNAPVILRMSPPNMPPLETGDHLSRDEFERRYAAMPHRKKAELIEGVVYMPAAAVRMGHHAEPHSHLMTWLGVYYAATPGSAVGDNASIRLDLDNMPQPDAVLLIDPENGGSARISEDDYVEGAPELVAEISASSVSIDVNSKFRVYQKSGVREYLVWRVLDGEFDWFVQNEGRFVKQQPDSEGLHRSQVFPGLWLDVAALLRGDLARVLSVVQQGIADEMHRQFVEALAARKSG